MRMGETSSNDRKVVQEVSVEAKDEEEYEELC